MTLTFIPHFGRAVHHAALQMTVWGTTGHRRSSMLCKWRRSLLLHADRGDVDRLDTRETSGQYFGRS